jgi:hypothetical protein
MCVCADWKKWQVLELVDFRKRVLGKRRVTAWFVVTARPTGEDDKVNNTGWSCRLRLFAYHVFRVHAEQRLWAVRGKEEIDAFNRHWSRDWAKTRIKRLQKKRDITAASQ